MGRGRGCETDERGKKRETNAPTGQSERVRGGRKSTEFFRRRPGKGRSVVRESDNRAAEPYRESNTQETM
jgi:hypothetical protein